MSTETKKAGNWLDEQFQDPEFQRLYAREDLIEDFLGAVEEEMQRQGVSRSELATRLGCKPANVTQMFRRTRNLTASTMVDIAFHLGLRLKLQVEVDHARSTEGRDERATDMRWSPPANVIPLAQWKAARETVFREVPASLADEEGISLAL